METEKKQSIGALWEKKSAGGRTYYTGEIECKKIIVFKNDHKKEDKHPTFRIFLKDEMPKSENFEAQKNETLEMLKNNTPRVVELTDDDDIPF